MKRVAIVSLYAGNRFQFEGNPFVLLSEREGDRLVAIREDRAPSRQTFEQDALVSVPAHSRQRLI